jgi:hypothetical protein
MLGHLLRRLRASTDGRPRRIRTPPPPACPDGFLYAAAPGERLADLAARFGVPPPILVAANPLVRDWAALASGQLLCVPAGEPFACCLMLKPAPDAPPDAAGVALARFRPGLGVQLLIAVAGVHGAEVRPLREGRPYRAAPIDGGRLELREPAGALIRFRRLEVAAGDRILLAADGRDCLPTPAPSPLAPF